MFVSENEIAASTIGLSSGGAREPTSGHQSNVMNLRNTECMACLCSSVLI